MRSDDRDVVAVVFVQGRSDDYMPTVASLRRSHPDLPIVAGSPDPRALAPLMELGASTVMAGSASSLVNQVWDEHRCHVLAITDTAVFPGAFLGPALRAIAGDMSVGTVSFFCNSGSFLSFPFRNTPVSHQIESLDEESITRLLREKTPDQPPAPIPFCAGPAVLLSAYALSVMGPLTEVGSLRAVVALADFSLRGRQRGFLDVVDPSTFCARPTDLGPPEESWMVDAEQRWLVERHPFFADILRHESTVDDSPLAIVHAAARAKVLGLRVLIDGSCLGPKEMGTQVQTSSLIGALSRRPDVERVYVTLAVGIPRYAANLLAHPKVDACLVGGDDISGFDRVDVSHRPFQPIDPMHPSWRKVAARTVVTVQDLASYHVGSYHGSSEDWLGRRHTLREVAAEVDGVIAISHDVKAHLRLERIPVDPERVFVVENGTDHLSGDEAATTPAELVARGFVAGEFALVLGTNYAHKNRDLAIRVVRELRRRGLRLALVLAGAAVPFGSSRISEAKWAAGGEDLYVIPDVTSEERNWLLRHASLVLYPTSAEGFGLVPYEAARFGTPTVLVPFGPLGEVAGDLPVTAVDWSPQSLADAAELLLDDPVTAQRQVAAALSSGQHFTWDATAAKLVAVYRSLLATPARGGDARG